jgi:uncharacterized protein
VLQCTRKDAAITAEQDISAIGLLMTTTGEVSKNSNAVLGTPTISIGFLALLVVFAIAEPVNCKNSTSPDEVTICSNKQLMIMDGELDRAYQAARIRWTASMSNSVKIQYEDWLNQRKACGLDEKCLMTRIVEEIKELDAYRPDDPTWILKESSPTKD